MDGVSLGCGLEPAFAEMFGPSSLVETVLGVGQVVGGQGLKIFEHLNSRVLSGLPLVKFLSDSFISLVHNSLEVTPISVMLFLILKSNRLNIANRIIFPKSSDSIFHGVISIGIDFIDRSDILSSNFMDNVGAIRFIPFFLLEKTQLSSLTKFFQIVI